MLLTQNKAQLKNAPVKFDNVYSRIEQKLDSIALIGLGYVGLPIALEFAKHFKVVGFDINPKRVGMMQNNVDPSGEIESQDFENKTISFTHERLNSIKSGH